MKRLLTFQARDFLPRISLVCLLSGAALHSQAALLPQQRPALQPALALLPDAPSSRMTSDASHENALVAESSLGMFDLQSQQSQSKKPSLDDLGLSPETN